VPPHEAPSPKVCQLPELPQHKHHVPRVGHVELHEQPPQDALGADRNQDVRWGAGQGGVAWGRVGRGGAGGAG
jgi:hypothetical protein